MATKQRIDFGTQAEWEAYLRDQPVQMRLDMRTRTGEMPHHAIMAVVKSDYLDNILSPLGLQRTVRKTCSIIKKSGVEFDAVAFRGFSGALVGPMIACRLKKGFLAVRKHEDENSHSSSDVEGAVKMDCRYIIIDDFINSGATIWNIVNELNKFVYHDCRSNGTAVPMTHKRKCAGVFLYNSWVSDVNKKQGFDHEIREIWPSYDRELENSFHLPVWTFSSK